MNSNHPSKYPLVHIGEVCSIRKGTTITKNEVIEGNVPVIAGGREPAYYHNVSNRKPPVITVSASGTAGYVNFFVEPIFASDSFTIEPVDPQRVNIFYLYITLKRQQRKLYALRKGVSPPHVYPSDVSLIKIPLPSIEEQKEIVSIISTWDNAISLVEELINLKELRNKYLIKKYIDDSDKFKGTRIMKLQDIGDFASAGVDKKTVEGEEKVKLVNYLDIYKKNKIKASDFEHIVSASQAKINKCNVKKADVFFTPSSETKIDIASSAVAVEDMPGIVYSYHIVRFRPKINLDLNFSAYMFMGHSFRKQASRYSEGSGQRYVISQNLFKKLEVPVPKLANQKKISNVLDSAYEEISLLSRMLKKYELQRKGIIDQVLLSTH